MATITTHQLAHGARTITFTAGAVADTVLISDGGKVAHAPTQVARDFYRSLLDKGWGVPETPEEAERAMQRIEAEGDREQTRREEAAKHATRSRMERMSRAVQGVG